MRPSSLCQRRERRERLPRRKANGTRSLAAQGNFLARRVPDAGEGRPFPLALAIISLGRLAANRESRISTPELSMFLMAPLCSDQNHRGGRIVGWCVCVCVCVCVCEKQAIKLNA